MKVVLNNWGKDSLEIEKEHNIDDMVIEKYDFYIRQGDNVIHFKNNGEINELIESLKFICSDFY